MQNATLAQNIRFLILCFGCLISMSHFLSKTYLTQASLWENEVGLETWEIKHYQRRMHDQNGFHC